MSAVQNLISKIGIQILNPFVELLMALAVVYFVWGVAKFVMNADNEQSREDGKKHMVYGIVGLFIMVGAWGIIAIIQTTIGGI